MELIQCSCFAAALRAAARLSPRQDRSQGALIIYCHRLSAGHLFDLDPTLLLAAPSGESRDANLAGQLERARRLTSGTNWARRVAASRLSHTRSQQTTGPRERAANHPSKCHCGSSICSPNGWTLDQFPMASGQLAACGSQLVAFGGQVESNGAAWANRAKWSGQMVAQSGAKGRKRATPSERRVCFAQLERQ